MSSRPDLHLAWCTHKAAKYAVEHWHYSQSMPAPPRILIGVWEAGEFVGCVIFSRGACPNLLRPFRLEQTEGCELTRVALREHLSHTSQIVSVAIRLLVRACPGLRLIVSFADPSQGHHGGIYQAGNWVFSGDTAPDYCHIDRSGKRWHSRQVRKNGAQVKQFGQYRRMADPRQMTRVDLPGKHRYLYPLDAEMRRQIEPLRKPYPKRAGSIDSDATASQVVEGGANPTPALSHDE